MSSLLDDLIRGILPQSTIKDYTLMDNMSEVQDITAYPSVLELNKDVLDQLLFYADKACEEKFKDLNSEIRFYGLIICILTAACVMCGTLFLTVSLMFFLGDSVEEELPKIGQKNARIFSQNIDSSVQSKGKVLPSLNEPIQSLPSDFSLHRFGLEHSFTADLDSQNNIPEKQNRSSFNSSLVNRSRAYSLKNVYTAQWDLTKKLKDKALFWNRSQSEISDYPGYDSLLDIYTNPTSNPASQGISTQQQYFNNSDKNNTASSSEYPETARTLKRTANISSSQFKKARNYSFEDSKLPILNDYDDEFTSARPYSRSSIQKTPQSKSFNDMDNIALERKESKLPISSSSDEEIEFQNISLLMEEEDEDENDDNDDNGNDESKTDSDWNCDNSESKNHHLISNPNNLGGDSSDTTNDYSELESGDENLPLASRGGYSGNFSSFLVPITDKKPESNSKVHSVNMSKIGPTYLHVYLNNVYKSWPEFDQRTELDVDNLAEQTDIKTVTKALKCFSKRNISDFKRGKVITKLKLIRFAYMDQKYHDLILKEIIKNRNFLTEIITNEKLGNDVKFEIYLLFYYSFCYESDTQLSFDFVNEVVKSMTKSISLIGKKTKDGSVLYGDGIKCLYEIICYSDLGDFMDGIFSECFKNINEDPFEIQNVKWELLKLVICEWMCESETFEEIVNIFSTMKIKMNKLINGYVEKDNSKFHEFILVWKMLREYSAGENKENPSASAPASGNIKEVHVDGKLRSKDMVKRRYSRKSDIHQVKPS